MSRNELVTVPTWWLNAQGWNAPAIAEMFECCEHTVRATLRRWQQLGLGGLWDAPGRGDKPRWQAADLDYLEQCLEQEARTYNSQQLAQKLEQERQVKLSADRIRRLMAGDGNAPATATNTRPIAKAIKQADFDTLKQAEREGHLLQIPGRVGVVWSPVSYSYSRMGEQRIEQTATVWQTDQHFRVWQPDEHFDYALAQGGLDSQSYLKVMDWQAEKREPWHRQGKSL